MSTKPSPGQLLRVLREQGLREIQTLTTAEGGESGNAFKATDLSGKVSIVKVLPVTGPGAESQLHDLDTTVQRLLELAAPGVAATYLAHMVLRQVEWSLRHYPGAPATQRLLRLARLVVDDLPKDLAR